MWEKLLKRTHISSDWVRYIFRTQCGRYLNWEMTSSILEGSVIHTHGDVTSIFRVSKQKKKEKTFFGQLQIVCKHSSTKNSSNCLAISLTLPVRSCSQASMHPFRYDNARIHLVPFVLLTSNWRIYYVRWSSIATRDQLSLRKHLSLSWKETVVLQHKVIRNHFSGSRGVKINGTMKTILV
jgi:hypothetical protein